MIIIIKVKTKLNISNKIIKIIKIDSTHTHWLLWCDKEEYLRVKKERYGVCFMSHFNNYHCAIMISQELEEKEREILLEICNLEINSSSIKKKERKTYLEVEKCFSLSLSLFIQN